MLRTGQRSATIATWNRNPADEEAMGAAHAPIWRRMIDVAVHGDLREATVLDYGCNQGGFLRMLYDRHPSTMPSASTSPASPWRAPNC
jgi:hypothetical protein